MALVLLPQLVVVVDTLARGLVQAVDQLADKECALSGVLRSKEPLQAPYLPKLLHSQHFDFRACKEAAYVPLYLDRR